MNPSSELEGVSTAGAQWVRCALQVNPFAYQEVQRRPTPVGGEEAYNKELVQALVDYDIRLIGITDHWRAERSEPLREACCDAGITVLPGFEATTSDGVHVLILFEPSTSVGEINRRISECGVSYDTGQSTPGQRSVTQMLSDARKWGSVAIPAHVTGASGLLTTLSGTVRASAVTSADLVAVALGGGDPSPGQLDMLYGRVAEYRRAQPLAVVRAADVNGGDDVSTPASTCWIRLSSLTAGGLGRALRSPETRVRLESPNVESHPRLIGLSVQGGFLDGLSLELNDELNVLIGGRGSGKSTVLESIRFALDLPALTERGRSQHEEVVKNVLGTAAKVTLDLDCGGPAAERFRIERTQGGPSRVFDVVGNQLASGPRDVLAGIEIYGQRELADVAEDPGQQAELLRRLLPPSSQLPTAHDLPTQLASNREDLARIDREIAALDDRLAELPAVQERLERLGGAGVAARLNEQSLLQREDRVLEVADERGAEAREALALLTEMAEVDALFASAMALADLPDRDVLAPLDPAVRTLAEGLGAAREQAATAMARYEADLEGVRQALSAATSTRREAVSAQLRALATDGIDGREFLALERTLAGKEVLQQNRDRFRADRSALENRRRQLVTEQEDQASTEVRRLQGKSKEVSARLTGLLRIDVAAHPDVRAIERVLDEHTSGRMIEVLKAVGTHQTTGLQLAAAGRQGLPALYALLSTEGVAVRTVADAGEPIWRALEEVPTHPKPTIELNIGDPENPEWRPITHLSAGQKATAMLLLLLQHGAGPLLIDQPEDDLDNAFVTAVIVPRLRTAKSTRQFVLCTHNANIPVLSDADLVAALTVTREGGRTRAALPNDRLGSLDTPRVQELVEDLLEGGRKAFETRRYRYGF